MISKSGMTSWSRGVECDEICCVALRKTWNKTSESEASCDCLQDAIHRGPGITVQGDPILLLIA
jgi:hypothetical protein